MVDLFEPQPNDLISADDQAELVRRSRRTVSGPGVKETEEGWFIRPLAREVGEETTSQTVVLARNGGEFPDHLECRAVDSDPEVYEPIFVAKPWFLRKTPWDGQTRGQVRYVYDLEDSTKRTSYDINDPPDTPEAERNKRTELISPEYLLADELTALLATTGIEVDTGEVDEGGLPILVSVNLLDMTGARDWTVFFERL